MIWDIIEDKIVAAGLARPGRSLFRQFMPADVPVGIMLRLPLTGIPVDPHIPGFYKHSFQVIARHTDPVDGAKLAEQVSRVLEVEGAEAYDATAERGRVLLQVCYAKTLPVDYPRLDGNSREWSTHFATAYSIQRL